VHLSANRHLPVTVSNQYYVKQGGPIFFPQAKNSLPVEAKGQEVPPGTISDNTQISLSLSTFIQK
jgi:hypothetical protein